MEGLGCHKARRPAVAAPPHGQALARLPWRLLAAAGFWLTILVGPVTFIFGDNYAPFDELLALVCAGRKTAICTARCVA